MSRKTSAIRFLIILAIALSCILLVYRAFFLSGGNLIHGDVGDARLYIAILEHWRAVVMGRAAFASPNFFAPNAGVLGYSDGVFLYVPFYLLVRILGGDRYQAFELTLILIRLVGFFGMYLLLRRKIQLGMAAALMGSAMFSISSISCIAIGHPQLATIAFVPWLIFLAFDYFEMGPRSRWSLWTASVLLGLMLFTGYYIGFFSVLAGALFAAIWILRAGTEGVRRQWAERRKSLAIDLGVAAVLFCISVLPFVMVYLPVQGMTGGRDFNEALGHIYSFRNLFNVSTTNLVWGRAVDAVYRARNFHTGEIGRGFAPVSVLFAALVAWFSIKSWRGKHTFPEDWAGFVGISCVVLYAISVSFFGWTFWRFVFDYVPGARAIRVPNRINHVIAAGIAILCAIGLHYLVEWVRRRSPRGRALRGVAIAILAAFLLTEQVNTASWAYIDRREELVFFRRLPLPPPQCREFYAVDPRLVRLQFVGQIDAMLAAREWNLPTLNGYSGWTPPGWRFDSFDGAYLRRVSVYAVEHGMTSGICSLDMRLGRWAEASPESATAYALGSAIDFKAYGNSENFAGSGWGSAEPGGTWTQGKDSILLLHLDSKPKFDTILTAAMHAYTPAVRPRFHVTITVNGTDAATWLIEPHAGSFSEVSRITEGLLKSGENRIDLKVDDPRSPAELHDSGDKRKLAIAMERLTLAPSQAPGS